MTLYALTLRQPWAFAVIHLGKAVENRTWKPPKHAIGRRIVIHAGKTHDYPGENTLRTRLRAWGDVDALRRLTTTRLVYGAFVGSVVVTGWARAVANPAGGDRPAIEYRTPAPDPEFPRRTVFNRWAVLDQFQWGLANPDPIDPPIPCKGSQGLWTVPPDLTNLVAESMVL